MIIIRLSYSQLTLSSLFALFLLLALANAPSYSQDGNPGINFGIASGSISSLDGLDGATWNLTANDTELGLKTVEFFIGQDNSTGIASAATRAWNLSVYLPEDNITVDSAFIEISMLPGATDISAGSVNIDNLNSTAIPLIQTTGPPLRMLYRYNATDALGNFTKGTNSFTLRISVTGPIIYQENAKLILTYRYNRNSEVQLRTVRFFAGSDGTAEAVGADTTSTFKLNIPEISPSVKSAWIENSATIPSGGATSSTYLLTIDNNYHLSGLTHTNVGGARDILVLYNATPFYTLTNGWSPAYTLRMRSVAGYILNLWGAEAVLTYTYNHTATMGNVTQKTVSYFAGANTTLISAGSITNFTFDVWLPEDEPKVESIWFRVTSDTATVDNTFTVNVNGSWAQNFFYDWITETDGITPILANGTNTLAPRMVQGRNNLTLSILNSAATASALSAEAIVTYNYSASSRTQQESVQYHAYQTFKEADTANVPKTGNWSITMPHYFMNVTSAYLQTDPTISNTGTSLTGATSTSYGTWVNGSGSSFSIMTTDEMLNARTLLNATLAYGPLAQRIMAGNRSSWGTTLTMVTENNYAHSAKFVLTYMYNRTSRVDVNHTSTAVSYSGTLDSVNATLRFMSQTTSWWNLTMYNWVQGRWTTCNSTLAYAYSWATWYCNITSLGYTTTDYVSPSNLVRINMNSTNLTLTQKLLEDYIRYDTVVSAVTVSIAVSSNLSNGVLFSSVDPASKNNNASGNYNSSGSNGFQSQYWVYTGAGSGNADFCIRDNESLRTGPGATPAYVIGNSNYTYSNATSGANSATNPAPYGTNNITATAQNSLGIRFATNMAPGQPAFLRFFLNVSERQPPGIYSNSVIFQAVSTGSSVTCGGT